jgi:hypothetical protein
VVVRVVVGCIVTGRRCAGWCRGGGSVVTAEEE